MWVKPNICLTVGRTGSNSSRTNGKGIRLLVRSLAFIIVAFTSFTHSPPAACSCLPASCLRAAVLLSKALLTNCLFKPCSYDFTHASGLLLEAHLQIEIYRIISKKINMLSAKFKLQHLHPPQANSMRYRASESSLSLAGSTNEEAGSEHHQQEEKDWDEHDNIVPKLLQHLTTSFTSN